jgi:hypothetical protein
MALVYSLRPDCLLVCVIGLLFWRKSREVNHEYFYSYYT